MGVGWGGGGSCGSWARGWDSLPALLQEVQVPEAGQPHLPPRGPSSRQPCKVLGTLGKCGLVCRGPGGGDFPGGACRHGAGWGSVPCPLPAPQAMLCTSLSAPKGWVWREGSGGDSVQGCQGKQAQRREGAVLCLPLAQVGHFQTPLRAEPGGCPGQNQALEDDMVQNSGNSQ